LKTLAVIVNYRVAGLTLRAVQSVLDSESSGPVQVVVIDNSEEGREAECLRSHLPSGVALVVNSRNTGFGSACNQAVEKFSGELILLLNPDAGLLPGCLLRLQQTLFSAEKTAAVGPLVYWDEGLTYLLPPSYPSALFLFQPALAAWGPQSGINRVLSATWRNHAIRVWRSRLPVKVSNLSGGHVLLKREAVKKAGGLFDPRFFLYFEDADLFLRLRQAGFRLFVEPRAAVVHHYDQSGRKDPEKSRGHMDRSHETFLMKHSRGWNRYLRRALLHFRPPSHKAGGGPGPPDFTAPFMLKIPGRLQGSWLFEWSPNSDFIPAAGTFGKGPSMDFSQNDWVMLSPGRYFGRLGSVRKFARRLKVVSWVVEGK